MSSTLKKIALVGASTRTGPTANLGTFVLEALTSSLDFDVTVISRKSSKSTFNPSVKVMTVSDTYPEDEMVEAFKGKDAVVLTTGHALGGREIAIVDAAIKAGVKRFIPSEFGSNSQNQGALQIFPMMGPKAKLIDYLRSKESSGMTWTAIATGLFLDLCLTSGFMGYDLTRQRATIWDSGEVRFSTTTRPKVAASVVQVLTRAKETANKYLYISSFETSMKEILASLEKATGGQKWETTHVSWEDEVTDGREALSSGEFMRAGKLALAASFKGGLGANFASEETLANEMIGLPKEDLDNVIAEIVKSTKCE